jgi:serine/threonine protein kinase/WD40 repeat protein
MSIDTVGAGSHSDSSSDDDSDVELGRAESLGDRASDKTKGFTSSGTDGLIPNQRIGNFTVRREIGRGGMGIVYEAVEEITNRKVALKILPPVSFMDRVHLRRFQNEAAIAAQLEHEHIVPFHSFGSDHGIYFYAMRLIEGQNLSQLIKIIRRHQSVSTKKTVAGTTDRNSTSITHEATDPDDSLAGSQVDTDQTHRRTVIEDEFFEASSRRTSRTNQRLYKTIATLGRDAARALAYAHDNGIIHRDIKPANLLLDDHGKIWVSDFGLARILENPVGTGTGNMLGTLKYMSPEQATGRKFLIDHRTDVYSLGVTLYELLSLKPAVVGKDARTVIRELSYNDPIRLRQINPQIPVELETIISKSIAKNPHERYTSALELADDLDRFCNDQPISARPPTLAQRLRRWAAKRPTLSSVIGAGIGLIFLASVAISALLWSSNVAIQKERDRVVELLDQEDGLTAVLRSSLVLRSNPGLAAGLAVYGSKRVSGIETNQALQAALDANHELRLLYPREQVTGSVAIDSNMSRAVSTVSRQLFGKGNFPAIVTDLKSGGLDMKIDGGDAITSAIFSPNGKLLLAASSSAANAQQIDQKNFKAASLWDATNNQRLTTFANHVVSEARAQMFSPDSSLLVLPGPGNVATVYQTTGQGLGVVLQGHAHPVVQVAFSPDGKSIATADVTGEIRIFSTSDFKPVRQLATKDAKSGRNLTFSSDSNFLIFSASSGTRAFDLTNNEQTTGLFWREPLVFVAPVQSRCACLLSERVIIREIRTGQPVLEFRLSSPGTMAVFLGNDDRIAIANGSRVSIHDTATGELLFDLLGHDQSIVSLAYDPRSKTLVTASEDGSVRFWSSEPGQSNLRIDATYAGRGSSAVHFAAKSSLLMTACTAQSQTLVYDSDGKRVHPTIPGRIECDFFSSEELPIVTEESTVAIVDPSTLFVKKSRRFENRPIREMVPLRNTNSTIILIDGSVTVLWDYDQDILYPLTKSGDYAISFDVSETNGQFLLGTADGNCQLHDSKTGKLIRKIPHSSLVRSVRFLPNSDRFVSIDNGDSLRVWGPDNVVPEKTLRRESIRFNDCYPSFDGRYILTFHHWESQPICCWDVNTGQLIRQSERYETAKVVPHTSQPIVACSSASKGLVVWNFETDTTRSLSSNIVAEVCLVNDRIVTIEIPKGTSLQGHDFIWRPQMPQTSIAIYSAESGERLELIEAQDGSHIGRIAIDAVNHQLAVSTTVYSSSVHDTANSRFRATIGNHTAPISFAQFVGDTNRAVTASWDGTAKIWGDDFRLLRTFGNGKSAITAAAITRDGNFMACGDRDGTLTVWNTSTGDELFSQRQSENPIVGLTFTADGKRILSSDEAGLVRFLDIEKGNFEEISSANGYKIVRLSNDDKLALLVPVARSMPPSRTSPTTATNCSLFELQTKRAIEIPESAGASFAAFGRMSNTFGLVLPDGVHFYDVSEKISVTEKKEILSSKFTEPILKFAFTHDEENIATLGKNGVSLWNTVGEEVHRFDLPNTTHFSDPAARVEPWEPLSNDDAWIALATAADCRVRPVKPAKYAAQTVTRSLQPAELKKYGLGLPSRAEGQ